MGTGFIVFLCIVGAILITLIIFKKKQGKIQSTLTQRKVIKQTSGLKIVLRLVGIIMIFFGLFFTWSAPEFMYGLTWTELGAIAEGKFIDDSEAMMDFLDTQNIKDLEKFNSETRKSRGESAFENCLLTISVYWAVCGALLFIHIKQKEIVVNSNNQIIEEKMQ